MVKMMTSRDSGVILEQNFSIKIKSFRKGHKVSTQNRKVALKQCQFYYRGVPWTPFSNPCTVKIRNGTKSKGC